MRHFRVARRFAKALLTGADEQKLLDRVFSDLEGLERLMKESREFMVFLKSPVINREKKSAIMRELFGKDFHALTMGFLDLLTEKGREDILDEIVAQFFALRDEKLGIVHMDLRAAVELSKDQHEQIRQKFERLTKKTVRIAFRLDEQMIGGFVARLGDTMFDASVRHQLELLRERFSHGVGNN